MQHHFAKWLGVLGTSALLFGIAPAVHHVSANAQQPATTAVAQKQVSKQNPQNTNDWRSYRSKVFIANRGYGLYKNNWNKVANSGHYFHWTFNVNGERNIGRHGMYYRLYTKPNKYYGFINSHAVVKTNKNVYLKQVPYVSQYRPVYAPWGCAEASLAMMIRSTGHHVSMPYIFRHTPMVPARGGQRGSVYTGAGFGHVITAAALTRYAHHWTKRIHDISGASTNQIKMYVQSGHPVLFYGYSSYQLPADHNRNHCKVITAYRNGEFRVYDPLYFSKYDGAYTQGRNPMFDRGAVSWYSMKRFNYEYAHVRGNNRKSALVAE